MKMMLLAAAAALTLGSVTAFASDGGDWYPLNSAAATQYQAPANRVATQQAPRQSAGSTYMYFGASPNQGQQFDPNFGGGGNG